LQEKICKIYLNDKPYLFKVEGKFSWGRGKCLYTSKNNIIGNQEWEDIGFKVVRNLLTIDQFQSLKKSITKTLLEIINGLGISIDKKTFSLENYHLFIKSDEVHQLIIQKSRELEMSDFNFDINIILNKLSNFMNLRLTSHIKQLGRSHIQLRLNRPFSLDFNPPHRDGYIPALSDSLNVWLPIAGCDSKTSLPLIPKSHLISESHIYRTSIKGAKINNNFYNVPCILKTSQGDLKMQRPNPKYTEALIFTPFLIHGAALNNSNKTRAAFELRFPRKF